MATKNEEVQELFDEVLMIHDYNIEAIALRVVYLADRLNVTALSLKKGRYTYRRIKNDLSEQKNLIKYEKVFLRITEELQGEANKFNDLAKFDIKGISSIFLILVDRSKAKDFLELIDSKELTVKKKEVIDLQDYCQRIIMNLEKFKGGKDNG